MILRYTAILLALPPAWTAASCTLPRQDSAAPVAVEALDLQQIMADPDWIGREPERPYWSDDSRFAYYRQKEEGGDARDLWRVDIESGEARVVLFEELGFADELSGDYDDDRSHKVYSRHGDLFLRALATGESRQLTRTNINETNPNFLADPDRFTFQRDRSLYVRVISSGMEYQPAELKLADEPEFKKKEGYLAEQQERLFDTVREDIRKREESRERQRALEDADPTRAPRPWYLGKGQEIVDQEISPDERWLIVVLRDEAKKKDKEDMPEFVTESGLVTTRGIRPNVGKADSRAVRYVMLDLVERQRYDLDLGDLPGIALESESAEPDEAPELRGVFNWELRWAPDSSRAGCMVRSLDNKDRWIFTVELGQSKVVPIHHLHDDAWVGFRFNEWDWSQNGRTLFFTSEETGYSQLYVWSRDSNEVRALTRGEYEIDSVGLDPLSDTLYYRANQQHPGVHEVYRVSLDGGEPEQLTDLGGRITYLLSPDSQKLLITHSKALEPPDLFVQDARPGAQAKRLTKTSTNEFHAIDWARPEYVKIPSPAGTIHARLYQPLGDSSSPKPAVFFIHGAGYLQNAHKGWSSYFREFMFHSLLVQQGYVVLDMDYRASAGYGRDWRTAIYRQMGTPELEDMSVAVDWLEKNHGVDRERIGVYGGSYGGFLTLMALFKEPDLFACGAALRPVTDWAHYNHSYTSNILNTPEEDPEAFAASSPIEFAAGLEKPLLICHGMIDSNVLAKDSIRLTQRLIELGKKDWELALYPVQGHGFDEPSSWYDEYRRIYELFEENLK